MTDAKFFKHPFYSEREQLVYGEIGRDLDQLETILEQLYSPCQVKIMNANLSNKDLTIQDILNMEQKHRQDIVGAILYNDGLWRIEAAYLMLSIGFLNTAFSNLRSCLESVVAANIAENIDEEAVNFLNGKKIDPTKLNGAINKDYYQQIKEMRERLGEWGVHSNIVSTRFGILGPNTFDKMISKVNNPRPQSLTPGFNEAAIDCVRAINSVFVVFMFLISRGRLSDRHR